MAVEDEVLLEFQGEDSSLSKTAQSVLNDINQLDISIQNLISTFNSFSQASGSAESSLSTFTKVSGNISEVNSHIDEMTKNFSDSVGAINETATSMEQLSNASQPIQEVTSSMEDLKKSAEQKTQAIAQLEEEIDRTSKANDKWKNSMKPIVAGISTLYGTLKRFTLQAAEAYRTQTRFNAVFDRQSGELREAQQWVNDYADALMLDNMEVENAVSRFRIFTNTMGVNNEKSKEMSMNMTQLAYDLAAVSGNDVSQTVNQLTSALGGQTKALKQYGIAIDKNTLQQTLNEHGINRKISSLTAAELAETRYVQIMERSAGIQGYYARTLMSPANALNIIKTQFSMLAREIGNVFIPILMALVPIVRAVTSALRSLAQAIAGFFGISINFDDYSDGFSMMAGGIGDVGNAADGASKKMKNMLRDFDNLHVIDFDDMTGSGSGAGGGAGGGGGGKSLFDKQEYVDWKKYLQDLGDKFYWLRDIVAGVAAGLLLWKLGKKFLPDLFKAKNLLDGISKFVGTILIGIGIVTTIDGIATDDLRKELLGALEVGTGVALFTKSASKGVFAGALTLEIAITISMVKWAWQNYDELKEKFYGDLEELNNYQKFTVITSGIGKGFMDALGKAFGKEDFTETVLDPWIADNAEIIKKSGDVGITVAEGIGAGMSLQNPITASIVIPHFFKTLNQKMDEYNLKERGIQIMNDIGTGLNERVEETSSAFDRLKAEAILKITLMNADIALKLGELKQKMSEKMEEIKTSVINKFEETKTKAETKITELKNGISTKFEDIKTTISNKMNDAKEAVRKAIDNIKSFFNFEWKLPDIKIPHFGIDWDMNGTVGEAFKKIGLPGLPKLKVDWYATGGFPNKGDLFIANEREPELVGSMGNRSAVANNSQIIEGIAQGSYQAFVRAMRDTQSDTGGDTYVYVGDTQLTDVVTKRRKTQDRRFGR